MTIFEIGIDYRRVGTISDQIQHILPGDRGAVLHARRHRLRASRNPDAATRYRRCSAKMNGLFQDQGGKTRLRCPYSRSKPGRTRTHDKTRTAVCWERGTKEGKDRGAPG